MKKILLLSAFLLGCAMQARGAALFDIAQAGNAAQLQDHISQNTYSKKELTRALHMAVEKNPDVDVITVLAKAGADVNINLSDSEVYGGDPEEEEPDGMAFGSCPLSRADENIAKTTALLQAGADPNYRDFEGATLLMRSVQSDNAKNMEILRLLLQYKANPNIPIDGPSCPRFGSDGMAIEGVPCTVLEFSLKNPEKVRLLLDAGAHTNRHIYALAQKKKLPPDLLQRLDPTRMPDGSPKTVKTLFSTAITYVENNDFKQCKKILDDLHRSFELTTPLLASLFYMKSICYEHDVEYAERALKLDATQQRNHLQYITALLRKNKYKQAQQAIKQAMRILPEDARLYLFRSICHVRLGNIKQASMDINRSLALKEMSLAYFTRGELHLANGDEEKAEADFIRAYDMGQRMNADMNLLYQAAIKERQGDINAAMQLAKRADDISHSSTKLYINAIGSDILIPAGLIDPARRNYFFNRSMIVDSAKNNGKDKGLQTDTRRMRTDSIKKEMKGVTSWEAAAFLYLLTFCEEDPTARLRYIDRAIKAVPGEWVYYYRRGELHFREGRYDLAQRDFTRAMEYGQQGKAHQNMLYQAYILAKKDHMQGALILTKRALALVKTEQERRTVEDAIAAVLAGSLPDIFMADNLDAYTLDSPALPLSQQTPEAVARQTPAQQAPPNQVEAVFPGTTQHTLEVPVAPLIDGHTEDMDAFL